MRLKFKKKLLQEKRTTIWLVLIVFLVIIIFVILIKRPLPVSQIKFQKPDLSLDIKHYLFLEGYTTPVITIKNLNDISWRDCEMKINEKYTAEIKNILPTSAEDSVQTIPLTQFARSDGLKLDYSIIQIKSACISCKKPEYDIFCGEFKYPSEK